MCSPRFVAETCKILLDPYWKTRLQPSVLAIKVLRGRPEAQETSDMLARHFLEQLGTRMPVDGYRNEDQQEAYDKNIDAILQLKAALHDMGKEVSGEGFSWGETLQDLWSEAWRSAAEKERWEGDRKTNEREKLW